jgi:hypothetical protein
MLSEEAMVDLDETGLLAPDSRSETEHLEPIDAFSYVRFCRGTDVMDQLKFVVLDEEDLEVVSTHLQDAVARVADVLWRPQEKRVVLAVNRFDWEEAHSGSREYHRRRAALRFERVLSCKCRSRDPVGKDAVLNLLAVEFTETEAPSGIVTMTFSGGATLRLEVECLEAELTDLGTSWSTAACPVHAVAAEGPPEDAA